MQYMGGKANIRRFILPHLLAARPGRPHYLEPFMGGGAMFTLAAPHFPHATGADIVPDLALMWSAIRDGWVPPSVVTRDEYVALRNAKPSALRGFVGFGCSFGGIFFGSYGASRIDAKHPNGILSIGSRAVALKDAQGMAGARFVCADYRRWQPGPRTVVYCDPPYAGTTPYPGLPAWDAGAFWSVAAGWAQRGAAVFVSERTAPRGWQEVWARPGRLSLAANSNSAPSVERLFAMTS